MAKAAPTITKTEAVRLAIEKLGKDTAADAAMKFVKDEYKLDLSKSHFFNIKSTLSNKGGKKRGRPRKVQVETAAPTASATPKSISAHGRTGISLADLQAIKGLADKLGAADLHSLVDVLA